MNTSAHLLFGAAAMGRRGTRSVVWAALAGALLPDVSLYLLAGSSIYLLDISPETVFRELYFSDAWQMVFAIDNSFFIWSALLALAFWRRRTWGIALCAAALLHLWFDFVLHHDDGRPHLWPLTLWTFESPFSYWDVRQGALFFGPFMALMSTVSAAVIWWRRPGLTLSLLTLVLLIAELMVARIWLFVFSAG